MIHPVIPLPRDHGEGLITSLSHAMLVNSNSTETAPNEVRSLYATLMHAV